MSGIAEVSNDKVTVSISIDSDDLIGVQNDLIFDDSVLSLPSANRCRIDTPIEVDYYRHGGILPYVLRGLIAGAGSAAKAA